MVIDITVGEEERLVAEFRAYLSQQARMLVAGSPERKDKRFARVTFPELRFKIVYHCDPEKVKIEWT